MTIETTLGEKYAPVVKRIERVATTLDYKYNHNIPRDDLIQEMWLALIERIDNQVFIGQPVKDIVNLLAWKARDYARKQFRYMNRLPKTSLMDKVLDPDEWEYIAVALDPYETTRDVDTKLTAIDTVDKLMMALSGRPRTLSIARSMLDGRSKVETARHLGIDPSTVTYHVKVMRKTMTGMTAH